MGIDIIIGNKRFTNSFQISVNDNQVGIKSVPHKRKSFNKRHKYRQYIVDRRLFFKHIRGNTGKSFYAFFYRSLRFDKSMESIPDFSTHDTECGDFGNIGIHSRCFYIHDGICAAGGSKDPLPRFHFVAPYIFKESVVASFHACPFLRCIVPYRIKNRQALPIFPVRFASFISTALSFISP